MREVPAEYVTVACHAMATRFEVALWGGSEAHLRAAGEEALEEVRRLDAQLSRFRTDSDLYEVNARAALEPVRVEPRVFRLLQRARALHAETHGAFDPTVGPLLSAWGFAGGTGRVPADDEIEAARRVVGMDLVTLDAEAMTVGLARGGVTLDLGAFGKGYAVEQAADVLRECGIGGALLHGGTSSVQAIGTQPDGMPWRVAVQDPAGSQRLLATALLSDRSLSVSAVHGRSFTHGGMAYGHVIDPRTGRPSRAALLAAVTGPSAADGDALSTALLVLGVPFLAELAANRPGWDALLLPADGSDGEPHLVGDWSAAGARHVTRTS